MKQRNVLCLDSCPYLAQRDDGSYYCHCCGELCGADDYGNRLATDACTETVRRTWVRGGQSV